MFKVPLATVPNQSVAFNVGGAYWQIKISQAVDHMCADVLRDGKAIIVGTRCFRGVPLMPYSYLHLPLYGNFVFDDEVDWTNFAGQCNLLYLDVDEYTRYAELLARGGL